MQTQITAEQHNKRHTGTASSGNKIQYKWKKFLKNDDPYPCFQTPPAAADDKMAALILEFDAMLEHNPSNLEEKTICRYFTMVRVSFVLANVNSYILFSFFFMSM